MRWHSDTSTCWYHRQTYSSRKKDSHRNTHNITRRSTATGAEPVVLFVAFKWFLYIYILNSFAMQTHPTRLYPFVTGGTRTQSFNWNRTCYHESRLIHIFVGKSNSMWRSGAEIHVFVGAAINAVCPWTRNRPHEIYMSVPIRRRWFLAGGLIACFEYNGEWSRFVMETISEKNLY